MNAPARSSGRVFSPLGSFQQVPSQETQGFLREQFILWGRPTLLRVDNGTPWGASGGMPTALQLWAAGMAVSTHHNDPCRPQQNGVVEKSQGTNKRWAEPNTCDSAEQLQQRSDEAARRQRERYPYRKGESRLAVFPQLQHSGRRYSRGWEEENWSLELAEAVLAEVVEYRRVDRSGCVSLYSRNVYVGKSWAQSTVWVRYDPQGHRWMFSDKDGRLLNHQTAPEICRDRIIDLTASDGRTKRGSLS
jgi:hypothetical protein